MTKAELERTMRTLEPLYDVVRLVDPSVTRGCTLDENGRLSHSHCCYDLLEKGRRCQNCISARTVANKKSVSKFEFVGKDAFFITTRYLEVDGEERSLELVKQIANDTILSPQQGTTGKAVHDLVEQDGNRRYLDLRTGTLDQRYLEDGVGILQGSKVAVLRISGLDDVALMGGAQAHDRMLRSTARTIQYSIRGTDTLVYLQDSSFALIFEGMSEHLFGMRLEQIRHNVLGALRTLPHASRVNVFVGAVSRRKTINELVSLAQEALEEAESGGPAIVLRTSEVPETDSSTPESMDTSQIGAQATRVDALTGMLKADVFRSRLNALIEQAANDETVLHVIHVDVENFKSFNRTYGIAEGDVLLVHLANALREVFAEDLTARTGIDTFGIATTKSDIAKRLDRLRAELDSLRGQVSLQLKAGICNIRDASIDARSAMDRAKIACDSIKGKFDKFTRVFDDDLEHDVTLRDYIVTKLDEALEKSYITPYYQAIVRAYTGEVCALEALSRWIDPELGMISPADVIPTLEFHHLIHKHDIHILRGVCRDLRDRLDAGKPVVPVSINLSRLDFELCDIFCEVERAARDYGIDRSLIDVEITESALDQSSDFFRPQVQRFREAGYRVWMDDFGSGYSSLNLLKDYEFDVLKIDMAFLRGLENSTSAREIVSSIVDMAKRIGIRTLAEGVESEGQLAFLRGIGCEMIQGYLYSRPSPEGLSELGGKDGLRVESNTDRVYFESIGRVNLLSQDPVEAFGYEDEQGERGMPLAIMDWDGTRLSFLSANEAYLEHLRANGYACLDDAEQAANVHEELLAAWESLDNTNAEHIVGYELGHQRHFSTVQLVARRDTSAAYLVSPQRHVR